MLRYRRYRVFLFFAIVVLFALYQFTFGGPQWDTGKYSADYLRQQLGLNRGGSSSTRDSSGQDQKPLELDVPAREKEEGTVEPPDLPSPPKPVQTLPADKTTKEETSLDATEKEESGTDQGKARVVPGGTAPLVDIPYEAGQGRLEVSPLPSSGAIHWTKPQQELFPVESTIQLPSGTPRPLPKVQYDFTGHDSALGKRDEKKAAIVKEAFIHAWEGYKKKAWGEDEIRPVSGESRSTFNGWGASLVDTLDTLWIMGMEDEFKTAVEVVEKIDFTTSPRGDIPVFETTIRYLGGLIAAYDMSGQKHPGLLSKAVQLGDVLMGAFDTPNRLPISYYYWKPAYASQPHRASNHVVMSELGSLSMEFTRLAQLTKEPKYYDAIARITNAFEEWQNHTRLPGMWPLNLDASGCGRVQYSTATKQVNGGSSLTVIDKFGNEQGKGDAEKNGQGQKMIPIERPEPFKFTPIPEGFVPLKKPEPFTFTPGVPGKVGEIQKVDVKAGEKEMPPEEQRQTQQGAQAGPVVNGTNPAGTHVQQEPVCEPIGLASQSQYGREEFSLGSMADSTYEYLPKEYILLGGLNNQYKSMYEMAIDTATKHNIFRPMLPDDKDILLSGSLWVQTFTEESEKPTTYRLRTSTAHLTCFVGGMYGLGAKIFNREKDLEIAKKLTEGCVWAYDTMPTGIMPESYSIMACDDWDDCKWNETAYHNELDPGRETRFQLYEQQIQRWKDAQAQGPTTEVKVKPQETADPSAAAKKGGDETEVQSKAKRQLDIPDPAKPVTKESATPTIPEKTPENALEKAIEDPSFHIKKPLTHEEFVAMRIKDERLPPGVTLLNDKRYLLRPEAIESVWYMHRITGDPHWREAGWRMFQAVERYTRVEFGHSAIDDVTKETPLHKDEMESFWMAETLKYYYLLFEDESVVNLDEWVLNTEAHPFRRPSVETKAEE
ncbi:seven-hairpin glycosidase [Rhizodiscina lignyota]|uniref:alpha-1,2-Mannosidase n=1 Tax=Rhizodiscina lignyota TaxID=1504668 RepID=A0A9P4IIM2_9PEZI|nr:seven-hairpin glycosidase [Rhizodiscina lignyota]